MPRKRPPRLTRPARERAMKAYQAERTARQGEDDDTPPEPLPPLPVDDRFTVDATTLCRELGTLTDRPTPWAARVVRRLALVDGQDYRRQPVGRQLGRFLGGPEAYRFSEDAAARIRRG